MGTEELKKRVLKQLHLQSERLKRFYEKQFQVKLYTSPVEFTGEVIITRVVGEEPLIKYKEIEDIIEARNTILAIWAPVRVFGREGILLLKCKSDRRLRLQPIEPPEIHGLVVLPRDLDRKGRPTRRYREIVEEILRWARTIVDMIYLALRAAT